MNAKIKLSEEFHSLAYGLAIVAFGQDAIATVINDKRWSRKYSHVFGKIKSASAEKYRTILPAEVVYEIAGWEECIFDFWADPDGEKLYAIYRHKKWDEPRAIEIEIKTKGYRQISNQKALLEYGAYCLFRAADGSFGIKGETGRDS